VVGGTTAFARPPADGRMCGMEPPKISRRDSQSVSVGDVVIGGGAPVSVQSMTNTPTADADATAGQVRKLADAGAELVRIAVPTREDSAALTEIVRRSPVPIIADVHFHFDRALEAIDAGVAKIRLNPGNIDDREQVRGVIRAAADANVAIRVGVNAGSVVSRRDDSRRAEELNRPMDELMVEKLADYLTVFEEERFTRLVLSAKSHDPYLCVLANRRLAERWDYPLHLGVTHAGPPETAVVRSSAMLGALLMEGIGETIRVSIAGDPVQEVAVALELLWSLRLRQRRGVELIACPTCGRLQTDILPILAEVRSRLADIDAPLTVAVMGCVVNGPGEADHADVAICAGRGKAVLYSRGKRLRTVDAGEIADAVEAETRRLAAETGG
ncbi:MAG: flavodoxin-dependent (E)-4-hydroxy-3-methylbut-2-enyl-diphosphate synthase, partial [Phycisphaerae bacterium]